MANGGEADSDSAHEAVSSLAETTHSEGSIERLTEPGEPGLAGGDQPAVGPDGTEVVEGFVPRLQVTPEAWNPDTSRPTDVAWATFGPPPPMPEVIVGADDRIRVPDPSVLPWRINASIQILAPDNQMFVGTAWFISPRTLVTAGHCVFIHDQQGRYQDWARAIRVMPGRNGTAVPYGAVVSTEFHSVTAWTRDRDARYDYGAITLPTDIGTQVGYVGLGVFEDDFLVGKAANISGYPGDKTGPEDGTQWYDARQIQSVDEFKLHYQIDTYGGQSGSAVHIIDGEQRFAVGIHTYGDSYLGNSATRITPAVRQNLMAWKK
jgi:glutamyl endopeptidase